MHPRAGGRPGCNYLFLSTRGGPFQRSPLAKLMHELARKAGLGKIVTPHMLRVACATHMLARGASLRHVQELLGHESPHTTQRYTRLFPSDLRKVLKRCHPRERRGRP